MSTTYEYEKYLCTSDTVRETLEKYGVAIFPGVLTENECRDGEKKMWDAIEQLFSTTGLEFKRDDAGTWRNFYELFPLHSMLLQHWGIGHSQAAWDVRQNPSVVDVFSKLWKTRPRDLLTSFDGVSFHLPPEKTNKGWLSRPEPPLHCDQSFTRNEFECVQSWVTFFDVNEGDATLQFLEGSHKYHAAFADEFGIDIKDDWYKLDNPDEYKFYYDRGVGVKAFVVEKVIW